MFQAHLLLLGSLIAGSAPSAAPLQDPGPLPPNVLVILIDDIGVDSVATYGRSPDAPPTPTMDALASTGVLFRNAWSSPNCSPTRATLQTGRYGFRTGIGAIITYTFGTGPALPLSEVTIPEVLDLGTQNAYAHGAFGKWHLGSLDVGGPLAPNMAGYAHFAGTLTNLNGGDNFFQWTKVTDGVEERSTTYATTDTVDSTLAFIASVSEPWMCSVNFHSGHFPLHEPPAHLHTQDLTGASVSTNPRAYFKAMVEALDTEIGRLLGTLDPAVAANTLIFLIGDNGTEAPVAAPPPYFSPGSKGSLYEGGINVPFIVSGPGVAWQGESLEFVHTVDVLPTIAGAAGLDLGALYPGLPIDGVDLGPHLADPAQTTREIAFVERFAPNGPGNPIPAPPCFDPSVPFCQADIGFGGPGNLQLSMCGEPLYGGAGVPLKLENCLPGAVSFLLRGEVQNAVPYFGGTIVPFPPSYFIVGVADANGEIVRTIVNLSEPATNFYQAASLDPSLPQGLAFSNAVRAENLEMNQRAARNARYKLIWNVYLCSEEFFDLLADPSETTDLLAAGPLSSTALDNYLSLRGYLDSL
ncbi:MAG: sulfatase-like hydrolase/transferase [Planctomycetota bacterium]